MDAVRDAAAEALERFPRIDGLVLSVVALVQGGPTILASGHEIMFATNVMGPFLFTRLLLDRLAESDGMVVHVVAPFSEDIDWDDLESIRNHKTGPTGVFWSAMTRLFAKAPSTAGEPLADLMLDHPDRAALNGAYFKRATRITKPDNAMTDVASTERLWNELVRTTGSGTP